jgi:hypothetical protein
MRNARLLVLVVAAGVVVGCGPARRDMQLEKAAKANWTRSLLVSGQENVQALAAWRSFCRECAPDQACSAEEQTIRANPRNPGVVAASLCEAQQYEDYRSKPGFLR